jgi:nicotinamide mononucleotide transporter
MTSLEIAANAVTTLSIWLAARNSRHTWSTGIVGCALFGVQFFRTQLYADATLQAFFLVTSVTGWRQWLHAPAGGARAERPVTRARAATLAWMALAAAVVTIGYGALLHRFTDAYMPYVDAAVLALSVVAQCLLMLRKIENWAFWIAVNTLSVPLFASRGLTLTAVLYAAYWFNAWYGLWRWRAQMRIPAAAPVAA